MVGHNPYLYYPSKQYTLLRLNTDWLLVFIESILVTTISPHFAWRAIGTKPIYWLLLLNYPKIPHVSSFMAYSYKLLRKQNAMWSILYVLLSYNYLLLPCNTKVTHTISAYRLVITPNGFPIELSSFSNKLNKSSPYYSHALKYDYNSLTLTPVIQPPWLLKRYNVQHHFLPILQYLSGSPTQHLSLTFKHLLFRNLKHMLNLQEYPIKLQSIATWTRVSNPPEYMKRGN